MSERKRTEKQCRRFQNILTGERRVKRSKNSISSSNSSNSSNSNSNSNNNNNDNNNDNNNGGGNNSISDSNNDNNNGDSSIKIKRLFESLEGIRKYSKVIKLNFLLNFCNLL